LPDGLVAPRRGTIAWNGERVDKRPEEAREAQVRLRAAGPRDLPEAHGRGEPAHRRGVARQRRGADVDRRALPGASLDARATRRRLSGGQQQQRLRSVAR
jgi:hypothetical protein